MVIQNDMHKVNRGRMTTKCCAMQSRKYSAGRVMKIMRPVWCAPRCIKAGDAIGLREELENQSAFAVEIVLCVEMTDRGFHPRNLNSQV